MAYAGIRLVQRLAAGYLRRTRKAQSFMLKTRYLLESALRYCSRVHQDL